MDPPITISGKCWLIFWPKNLNCDHKITIKTLFSAKKILFIVVQTEPHNKFLPHVYTFLLKDPRCSPIIIHLTYKPQQYLSIYQSISIYYYLYQSIIIYYQSINLYQNPQVFSSQLSQLAIHLAWQSSSSLPVAMSNLLPNHQIYIVANSLNINCNIVNRQLAIHPGGQSSASISVAMRNILSIY